MAEAARHTHALWGMGNALDAHVAHAIEQQTRSSRTVRYAGMVDGAGRVLASLKRSDVALATPGGPVPAVGIGALFTREDRRGRGLATQLLQQVMAEAREAAVGAAWLYSDIAPAFYERLGYVAVSYVEWSAATEALPQQGGLPLRPTQDTRAMLALYEQSWSGPWLRAARSEASFAYHAWRNRVEQALLLGDVGYVAFKRWGDILWIDDLVTTGGDVEPVWAALGELARACGSARVAGWLRPEHAGGPFVATARRRCIPMIASLDGRIDPSLRCHLSAIDHF